VSTVAASIEIAAPPARVWEVLMDAERLREWVTIHRRLGEHDAPLDAGGRIEQTMSLRGVALKVHWKVEEWDPPRRAVWEGRGPARSHARGVYELSPTDWGTRFDYRNEFKVPGGPFGAVVSRALVGGSAQKEAHASLERLKRLIEG
jgi:uncharacterized protein YndB with AHSA1/START domain